MRGRCWVRPTAGAVATWALMVATSAHGLESGAEITKAQAKEYAERVGPPYNACDGYGPPGLLGLWLYNRPTLGSVGPSGALGCTIALGELQRESKLSLRAISLLRARALHQIAAGNLSAAGADLDAVEAAATDDDDPYIRQSVRLGAQFLRALILRVSGDQTGAERLALAAATERPFSRQTTVVALLVIGPEANFVQRRVLLERLAQLDPALTGQYYEQTFEEGDYAKVVELFSGLESPKAYGDEPMQERQRLLLVQQNRATGELFWARAAGEKAYALAALGRAAEARGTLSEANARLQRATPAAGPLPAAATEAQRLENATYEQTNLKIRAEGPPILEAWSELTEARLAVAEGRAPAAVARLQRLGRLPPTAAVIDLLEALAPYFSAGERPDLQRLRDELAAARTARHAQDLLVIANNLPEIEARKRVPSQHTLGGILVQEDGHREEYLPDSRLLRVRYRGLLSTRAMVQEDALLRACELAENAGKNGLIIRGAHDIAHYQVNTFYTVPVSTNDQGIESDLDVELVDPQAFSAEHPAEQWRVISTGAVRAKLTPLYRPSVAGAQ